MLGDEPAATALAALSPDERELAAAFRANRAAAYWPLRGYRFRLAESLRHDLGVFAPFTVKVLEGRGCKVEPLVERFLAEVGWRDRGSLSLGECGNFLAFVARTLEPEIRGIADLAALEGSQLELLMRLAGQPEASWCQQPYAADPVDDARRYQRSAAVSVITLGHDLSAWLERPEDSVTASPPEAPQHFVVFLRSLEESPQFVEVHGDAIPALDALSVARTPSELAEILGESVETVHDMLRALLDLGVLRVVRAN